MESVTKVAEFSLTSSFRIESRSSSSPTPTLLGSDGDSRVTISPTDFFPMTSAEGLSTATSLCDSVTSLCDAKTSLCDAVTSLCDAVTSLCEAVTSLCDAVTSTWSRMLFMSLSMSSLTPKSSWMKSLSPSDVNP